MTKQVVTEDGGVHVGARTGGNMLCQLITPGIGSSGVYTAEALQQAADDKVFPAGTLCFADHPGENELYDRPERSIRDVAAVLVEDARWDDETGALIAEARTFSPWTSVLAEMKDAIGMSIRATADVAGVDKTTGKPVISRLIEGISVDFVTKAGRGGAIREVYESARERAPFIVIDEATPDRGPDPAAIPTVVPAPAGQSTANESEETNMATTQIEEARLRQLEKDAERVQTLESERDALKAEIARRDAAESATTIITDTAKSAGVEFTALEARGLLAELPMRDGALDVDAFTNTVAAEATAKTAAAPARESTIRGFGSIAVAGGVAESRDPWADIDTHLDIKEA